MPVIAWSNTRNDAKPARVTEVDIDLGGQCQALMIGELFASVPGQPPVKFAGQSLRLLDECRDDAFGILIRDLDQHHVVRMALDKCCNIAVPRSADQITLPVAWDRTIFNRCRSFSDRCGILDLAKPVPFQAGLPGATDRAFPSQVLRQLFYQHAARLNEQATINRLV